VIGARAWALLLTVLTIGWAGPEVSTQGEIYSEIGDLWRERDAFYLRADGRTLRVPGVVPAGVKEITVRVEAMTRGRDWPGRWTMVEVEVQADSAERVTLTSGSDRAEFELGAGVWTAMRLPLRAKATDVVIRAVSGASGSRWQFRRVRLVDDRRVYFREGWTVERAAGVLRLETSAGVVSVPSRGVEVLEVGLIRARVRDSGGKEGAVYATGRVAGEAGSAWVGLSPAAPEGDGRVEVRIGDDVGRIDRQSEGDADGDGYNEARGATVIRVSARRLHLFVRSPEDRAVRSAAIEVRGLPAGPVTVLRDGAIVERTERLADGTLLLELPGEVLREQRVDIRVEESR
jgi:hypothetical protein